MGTYANFINEAAQHYFAAHTMPKREMGREILGLLRERRSFFGVAQDMMRLLRGMRG